MIDRVEVGRDVSPHLRVAFEVADTSSMTDLLSEAGAMVIAPPTRTPWDSVNSRLAGARRPSADPLSRGVPNERDTRRRPFVMTDI